MDDPCGDGHAYRTGDLERDHQGPHTHRLEVGVPGPGPWAGALPVGTPPHGPGAGWPEGVPVRHPRRGVHALQPAGPAGLDLPQHRPPAVPGHRRGARADVAPHPDALRPRVAAVLGGARDAPLPLLRGHRRHGGGLRRGPALAHPRRVRGLLVPQGLCPERDVPRRTGAGADPVRRSRLELCKVMLQSFVPRHLARYHRGPGTRERD
mmetsp:Transcript_89365/g.253212  ORF Transcript_89365/g.253212 Transcript_89365/m.253212 type:complete len:208 (-) Transcript_89365:333-956(-)